MIPHLVAINHDIVFQLVNIGNAAIRRCAIDAAFRDIHIYLPTDISSATLEITAKIAALIKFPKLASAVRSLHFSHRRRSSPPLIAFTLETDESDERYGIWSFVATVVRACHALRNLEWEIGFGLGEPVWQAIGASAALDHLHVGHGGPHPGSDPSKPTVYPRIAPRRQRISSPGQGAELYSTAAGQSQEQAEGRYEAWHLGRSWKHLTSLKLGPLSDTGAKVIATHLPEIGSKTLRYLTLETHFLDTLLCDGIARAGAQGVLTHLELSTTGVKFNENHLKGIIEGCRNLKHLCLNSVEGHLHRDTWSLIEDWPRSFVSLEIVINETMPHKTWATDHLDSICSVPMGQLERFAVRRQSHPTVSLPFPPPGHARAKRTSNMDVRSIPSTLSDVLTHRGHVLSSLCITWWEISGQGLLSLISACQRLKRLEVSLSAPLSTLVGNMPKLFPVPRLERLTIVSDPELYPPVHLSKVKNISETDIHLDPYLRDIISQPDSAIPDAKDIKRFMTRLPALQRLLWTGRGGRGEWIISRKSVRSSLTDVQFIHAALLSYDIYKACQEASPKFDYPEIVEPVPTLPMATITQGNKISALTHKSTMDADVTRTPHTPKAPLLNQPIECSDKGREQQCNVARSLEAGNNDLPGSGVMCKSSSAPAGTHAPASIEVKSGNLKARPSTSAPTTPMPSQGNRSESHPINPKADRSAKLKPDPVEPLARIIPGSGGRRVNEALPATPKGDKSAGTGTRKGKSKPETGTKAEAGWTLVGVTSVKTEFVTKKGADKAKKSK